MTTHPNDEKPYSEEEVARARELLATEYERFGWLWVANNMRDGLSNEWQIAAVRAICAALRTANQPSNADLAAKLREKSNHLMSQGGFGVEWMATMSLLREAAAALEKPATPSSASEAVAAGDMTLHGAIDHWQERALAAEKKLAGGASASEAVAWQELSNGRWTEITKDRLDHLVHLKSKYPHLEVSDVRALYLHPTLHQPPSGEWVMVPREPSIAMIVAAVKSQEGDAVYKCVSGEGLYNMEEEARCAYRAMLAASGAIGGDA